MEYVLKIKQRVLDLEFESFRWAKKEASIKDAHF